MKKFKIITVLLLIAIIASLFVTVLVACDPKENGPGSGEEEPSGEWPIDPWPDPDPTPGPDPINPSRNWNQMQFLNKIVDSVEAPNDVLNINIGATVDNKKDTDYTVALKANIYEVLKNLDEDGNPIESTKGKNELAFTVHSKAKTQGAQQQLLFGMYFIGDKMYIDRADGSPLLYLSDFDFNYLVQVIYGAGGMVGDLISTVDPSILSVVKNVVTSFLLVKPVITENADKSFDVRMEIKLNEVLSGAKGILGALGLNLPVEIGPIIDYIGTIIPQDEKFYLTAGFTADEELTNVGLDGVRPGNLGGFTLDASIELTNTASADIGVPDEADIESIDFSFTNLQFAIDLKVASQIVDGKTKSLDVGKLINGFLPTANIPEGLLLLNGGTGLRLSFKLDLDLDYDKTGVDNNKIAIELFLLDPYTGKPAEIAPQIGIYYIDGSFYLNTDSMLPNYLNGLNIKLDASMSELMDILVSLITDAIDKTFGISFDEIRKQGAQLNDDGSIGVASMSAAENLLQHSTASVVALASDGEGGYKLSAGIANLVNAVAAVLGLGGSTDNLGNVIPPNLYTDDTSIKVVVNNTFFEILSGLIPQLAGIKLPSEIGDIVLSINTFEGGIEDITVNTSINNVTEIKNNEGTVTLVDPALDVELAIGNFLIGFEQASLGEYINGKIDINNTDYLTSLNGVIDHMLGGIRFSSGFNMVFDAGTYDLAPFIAGFGVKEVENSHILWEFTDRFVLDASLNLQIALNRTDTAKSMIVLEMKTESGIKVGNGDDYIIAPNQVILGIYGYNNNIYIDISNFNIAGIVLPKLSFSLNFTDLVYTLLDDVVSKLLAQINVTGGDLKFELNFKELFGLGGSSVAGGEENAQSQVSLASEGETNPPTSEDISSALVFMFNTDKIQPVLSLATVLAILSATGTDLGNTLSEALKLMQLDLSMEMTRKEGFTFSFAGEFIPKLDENGEGVYYYDGDGNKIAVDKDKNYIFKNILERPSDTNDIIVGNTVYYTTKKYNYGSNMKLVFQAGTEKFPVIVGNLGQHKYPIEDKVEDFKNFKSDLVQAIVDTVGKASVALDIDLHTLDNDMNVTKLINSILANFGKKLELPISLDLDDWSSHVQLLLSWNLDLTKASNSKILLELKYEEKNIIGLYIYRNSIIVDLEGLGLFKGEIVNSSIVSKVFGMIDAAIKNIGDLDLNKIINDLLKNAGLPTVGTKPEGDSQVSRANDGVATDGNVPTIGEGLQINDFIAYLTQAIHLEDTAIVIDFTSAIINGMLNELVGLNLGIDLGVNGKFDLFGDSMDLGIHVEDIDMDAKLSLSIGKEVIIPVNFDDAPDWDASSGRNFTNTLLNNLNIGFTIDLANYTNDTVNLQQTVGGNSTDNYRVFTRIIIEKITDPAGKILTNVGTYLHAPQGAFLVTLAHINKAMYDDNQSSSASMTPMVYVILDHRKSSGQLTLAICTGLVTFLGLDIGNLVGVQNIDLDLVGMLAPVIDNLFTTIDGALDGLGNSLTGGGASTVAADEPAVVDEPAAGETQPSLLDEVFANLDVIKLLGEKGIMLALRANGNFNVTIEFDPYLINKLIDDVLKCIFAKNTGHASMLNLKELAPNMFDQDYLSQVVWTREIYGQDSDTNSFWGSLRSILTPMLKGLVSGLGYGWAAPLLTNALLGDIYKQIRKIVSGLLPFAVWNTATLEVNVVDATIANIHFRGQDEWQHIYVDNDPSKGIAYDKDKSGRGGDKTSDHELFYTEIFIYNSSASVGEHPAKPDHSNPENTKGIVTWADIPTNLTYMPYIYADMDDGVETLINEHFTNKTAVYQRGTTIMRTPVTFKIVDNGYEIAMNSVNLKNKFENPEYDAASGKYMAHVVAIAAFSNGATRRLSIEIEVRDEGGGIKLVDDIEMHAYDDSLPDFLTIYTNDGNSRKINTKYLTVTGWRPNTYTAHDVVATVHFKNGVNKDFTIHYLDSTVNSIIIGGVEGRNVNVDLYSFNLETSQIEDYTPQVLYFKYPDGKAVGLDAGAWTTAGKDGLFGRELDQGKYSTNVDGYEFAITTSIKAFDGAAEQKVDLVFTVKTKNVQKMTINGAVNKISIDPYEYYMYMIGWSEKNPFPSVATADYYDEYSNYNGSKTIIDAYSEDVNVVWKNVEGTDFTWDNAGDVINDNAKIALDNSQYPDGTFTWEFPTQVSVLRNEVEAIYFDEAMTQATYYIDPFQYVINGKGIDNFQKYAWVKFTNGAVYRMPIAWEGIENINVDPMNPSQFNQFDVYIGFDIDRYNADGTIISHSGIKGNLLQQTFVNVQVENRRPKGLQLDGSALMGGTYYIDPIQVLYYGMDPFPSNVTVEYMSGKTSVLEVSDRNWARDFEITMKGKKGLKATLVLNEQYSFDIDVEIIDRTSVKSQLTNLTIDPYVYTTDSSGNRVYSSYTDTMMLYQSVGSFDAETFEITGANRASMGTFAQDNTYFVYKLVYRQDDQTLTVTERDIDYIKDFVRTHEGIEIISTEIIEYFEVPIAWDLNDLNYSIADTYTVKATVQAKHSQFNKDYKVDVEILAKKIVGIKGIEYIMVGGTNLSDAAKQTRRLTLNKKEVLFEDGSSGEYECTIDLSGVNFESVQATTLRNTTYSDGRVVTTAWGIGHNGEDVTGDTQAIEDCALNIKATVCSGDIAQETTVKVHILDNVVATA